MRCELDRTLIIRGRCVPSIIEYFASLPIKRRWGKYYPAVPYWCGYVVLETLKDLTDYLSEHGKVGAYFDENQVYIRPYPEL